MSGEALTAELIQAELRAFIVRRFLGGEDEDLGPTTLLLATGIIDSFGIMELLEFVRERFGIVLPENEIHAGNMEHLEKISDTLLRVQKR